VYCRVVPCQADGRLDQRTDDPRAVPDYRAGIIISPCHLAIIVLLQVIDSSSAISLELISSLFIIHN